MDFTPEDMEAVQSCLEGIDRNVPMAVEPAAAKLLMPDAVTVADILALTEWPAQQLRLVVKRWQPTAECQDRADTGWQVRPHIGRDGHLLVASENSGCGAEAASPTSHWVASRCLLARPPELPPE